MEDWIYVTRTTMPPIKSHVQDLYDLWGNRHLYINGEKHDELQRIFASELGVSHVSLTANSQVVLEITLKALGCTGEVITAAFPFTSNTQAIMNSGCKPVFCDIDQSMWTIDASKIEALITPRTSAIFAVHSFGRVCDVEQIEAIAKKYQLKVIYDASHAYKVKVNNEPISKFGDCTIFCLHASKLFHAVEGGAMATNDVALVKQFEGLRDSVLVDHMKIMQGGTNARMSEFHATMGLYNINYVDGWIAKRKELFERYLELLKDVSGFIIPKLQTNTTHNYSYFPIFLDMEPNGLIEYLKEHKIIARKYFYPFSSRNICEGSVDKGISRVDKSSTPISEYIADHVLFLPLYTDLTFEQVEKICACIKEYIQLGSVKNGQAPSDVVKKELTLI